MIEKCKLSKASRICFYVTGAIYLLFLLLVAVSSDQGQYLSLKDIVQMCFARFILPGIIVITVIGCVLGILAVCETHIKQGILAILLNLLIIAASGWYIWAYQTGVLYRMRTGQSRLQYALDRSDLKMLKKEFDRGVDVNTRCRNDETPLIHSIWFRNKEMFDIVLAHHPDVNVYCNTGNQEMALHYLAGNRRGSSEQNAGNWNSLEAARILLDHGADPNLKVISSWTGKSYVDITPLSLAYENNMSDFVDLLLSYGADVNVKTHDHEKTLLHLAVERGDIEMVERLIGLGAKLDVKVNNKPYQAETPLQIAVRLNHMDIAKILIDRGADINLRDADGTGSNAPLHTAVFKSDMKMVEFLVGRGADVNAKRGVSGPTPLLFAVLQSNGKTDIVQYLLEHGADPNLSSELYSFERGGQESVTPLTIAYRRGYSMVVDLLLRHGAKRNDENVSIHE